MSHTKRHSLAITTGPKPLHLINNPNAPATAPHSTASFNIHSPPYSPVGHVRNPRRQSSISYVSSGDAPILSRSTSLLQRGERDKKGKNVDRRSVFSAPGEGEKQRPPLTLAEKHADLLHFIAQKESKCLELRSQLAVHEAELLQLKRKWERIVNRGFERQSTPVPLAGSPTLVDGIKEGVQGMSRLLSVSAPSYPPTRTPTLPLIRTHHPKPSTSTISTSSSCTSASKSTRFSLSSTSSIEEDKAEDGVLIVRDTGATPTMSPNPDWVREVQRKQLGDGGECIPRLSLEEEYTASATSLRTKKLRRRSGGAVPLLLLDEFAPTEKDREKERATLAPVSSIPGLGSLSSPNGGWVESMGKKLGELRGGAGFTKSQKRASLLISDVSNTFLSALSSPSPQSSSSYNPSPPSSSYTPSPLTPSRQQSLLDDDDDFGFGVSPVLKPSPMFTKPMIPTRSAALEAGGVGKGGKGGIVEEEDEWNW